MSEEQLGRMNEYVEQRYGRIPGEEPLDPTSVYMRQVFADPLFGSQFPGYPPPDPNYRPGPKLRKYYFTFGVGHVLVAYCSDTAFEPEQVGISLADKFVLVHANDEEEARELMIKKFAHAWCSCVAEDDWQHRGASYTSTLLLELRAK